jgi:hypothetical protein
VTFILSVVCQVKMRILKSSFSQIMSMKMKTCHKFVIRFVKYTHKKTNLICFQEKYLATSEYFLMVPAIKLNSIETWNLEKMKIIEIIVWWSNVSLNLNFLQSHFHFTFHIINSHFIHIKVGDDLLSVSIINFQSHENAFKNFNE